MSDNDPLLIRLSKEDLRYLGGYDRERSEREYWAEHGSPALLHRKLINEWKKRDRMEMGFWSRMFDRLIDLLFPRFYERMWCRHVQLPWMRMIRCDYPDSEKRP